MLLKSKLFNPVMFKQRKFLCFQFFLLFIFLPNILAAAVKLQYLPFKSVQQTNKLTIEIKESLPILNMSTKGSQVFKYELFANNSANNQIKDIVLPAAMTMIIKDMFILLNVNGQEVNFDPRAVNAAPPLMQFSKLIDQRINLPVNSHGNLDNSPEVFEKLYKELPALKPLALESFFNDLVSELFALYGEELTVGAKIEMQSTPGPAFAIPATLIYEIVSINDNEILANLSGTLPQKRIILDKTLNGNGDRPQKVEMTLSGTLKGTASWQRDNAMVHNFNCDYKYLAQLRSGTMRWTMTMDVNNTIITTAL